MPVQIDRVHSEVEVQRPSPASPPASSVMNGIDRSMLEQLRPMVLQILKEELERLRRQQG
ncbi:MAG: hypothetical protein WA746_31475 [Isosphaeraceae bacterium]